MSSNQTFRFPGPTDRVSICGMTGSGKTRFGIWLFSFSGFKNRPYVIIDFKGDDLISQIPRAKEITLSDIPKHPGLYIVRPRPDQQERVNNWLWKIWERGNIGIFIDEGYMIDKSPALNAILTQGRSLKIPTTILTQRPVWCSRFVFSEANYYAVFYLNDIRDYQTLQGFTPRNPVFDYSRPLPNYTCRWYDVSRKYSTLVNPVPSDAEILDRYENQLRKTTRGI